MEEIKTSVVIERTVDAVFDFMAVPENDMLWQSGVLESKKISEGPMGVGALEESVTQMLGQRIITTYEVTAYEPNQQIEYTSTSGPIQVKAGYTFEANPAGGTKVHITIEAEAGGFFKLAEPIMLAQLMDGAKVDIGLARACLHLDSEAGVAPRVSTDSFQLHIVFDVKVH